MSREAELLKALQRFETKITIDAMGASSNILNNAIAQNVKIAYYLVGLSASMTYFGGPKLVFNV